jgi:hypothetical protein
MIFASFHLGKEGISLLVLRQSFSFYLLPLSRGRIKVGVNIPRFTELGTYSYNPASCIFAS